MYSVPAKCHEAEVVIKKSRFISRAMHVTDRNAVREFLSLCHQDFPNASHHCWAYLLGDPQQPVNVAMSDDGEPSGTAGKPILNVLQHKPVGDVMVVVIRYFGGIKLGAGGLVRAYSRSAQEMMESLEVKTFQRRLEVHVRLPFAEEARLRYWVAGIDGQISKVDYGQWVDCWICIPHDTEAALDALASAYHWQVSRAN